MPESPEPPEATPPHQPPATPDAEAEAEAVGPGDAGEGTDAAGIGGAGPAGGTGEDEAPSLDLAGEAARAGTAPETDAATDPAESGAPSNVQAEHGGPRVADRTVVWQLFVGMGLFVVVIAIVYWFTSYEDAGSVLLLLAAVLGLWFGVFLWLQQRHPTPAGDAEADVEGSAAVYLPHASVWPLVIGLGAASIANGLVLGTWVVVPGLAALGLGIGGFVRQSRRRD